MRGGFRQSARSRWRGIVRGLLLALLLILALPYFLAPLYRFVDPVSTLMLWRWASGERVERVTMPLSRLSRNLPLAVIMAEDSRFCSHNGVDFQSLQDVMADAGEDGPRRGGSTITQQLAKNLFLWPGRSFVRKGLEFPLALWLDFVLPKARIMEIYLNIAEWGPNGEFGAEAAARRAFGKPAAALNRREAALLAAVLPNPRRRDTRRPGRGLRGLAAIYERRAAKSSASAVCLRPRAGTGRIP